MMSKTAAVLGAGIQGCCAALALSRLGFRVYLYDKSPQLLTRASVNQEGKIHLGFVYARDESQLTARTMIAHALQFAPAVETLVGQPLDWEAHLSRRFLCAIHQDSSITREEHYAHFEFLQSTYEELAENPATNYLGTRPERIWRETRNTWYRSPSMQDVILTEERAIHPGWMRDVLFKAVQDVRAIIPCVSHEVRHVAQKTSGFEIGGLNMSGDFLGHADIVVNCLWEGKNAIDRLMQLSSEEDWVTRIKYGFILASDATLHEMPSLILTHGPFGDIVNYPGQGRIYVTWYPACMSYFGNGNALPAEWDAVCSGIHPPGLVDRIYSQTIAALSDFLPMLGKLRLEQVMAGAIMGQGKTDISDKGSGLHNRHGIGVVQQGNYYSVFTGKYTSAPANAMALQALLA